MTRIRFYADKCVSLRNRTQFLSLNFLAALIYSETINNIFLWTNKFRKFESP